MLSIFILHHWIVVLQLNLYYCDVTTRSCNLFSSKGTTVEKILTKIPHGRILYVASICYSSILSKSGIDLSNFWLR